MPTIKTDQGTFITEDKEPKSKLPYIAFALILCIAIAGFASATYLMTSNHITGIPTPLATLTLTANSTTPTVGDTLQLAAHVSDNQAGIPITLTNNDALEKTC